MNVGANTTLCEHVLHKHNLVIQVLKKQYMRHFKLKWIKKNKIVLKK
jgi:hypothetical protein